MRRRALERYGALLSAVAAAAWSGGAAPSDVFVLLEHVFAEGLQPTASFYSVAIEAAIGAPSVRGLTLLVYEAFSYSCMRP